MPGPVLMRLPDNRLHFQHGPIDLIIMAEGPVGAVEQAYAQGWRRFSTILDELTPQLATLRKPLGLEPPVLAGDIAQTMLWATWPYRDKYITPMAAVAGSVAEHTLQSMVLATPIRRGLVNNGGDIAIYLAHGEKTRLGIAERPDFPELNGAITLRWSDTPRGVATSGWRGRSQSRGIADAVTVLARSASKADAAATMIANEVNVEHDAISRKPAREVKDDSDLGEIPVTVDVRALPPEAVEIALQNGALEAERQLALGLIEGAVLLLQGEARVIGDHVKKKLLETTRWY